MKKKGQLQRIFSILLACMMILNVPVTALASDADVTVEVVTDFQEAESEAVVSETTEAAADLQGNEEGIGDEFLPMEEEMTESQETAETTETTETESVSGIETDSFLEAVVVAEEQFLSEEVLMSELTGWEGQGTAQEPYLLKTTDDLVTLSEQVAAGNTFTGQYLKMAGDISLPQGWTPVGPAKGIYFSGNFDGDGHLLTIPAGEKCLFGYTKNATLSNLNIYGTKIASAGVVANYEVGTTIQIDNVTLKAGTQTLMSGFLGGYASGSDAITIKNSTVEKGVVIGYDKNQKNIGSFGGDFNGTIVNCTSYADVYGTDYVGGISGNKGQTMGTYDILDCTFGGTVTASGNYAGGISGGGYGGTMWGVASAKNTPCATIKNCKVSGTVTGADYVGGVLGAETGVVQCWSNGIGYIQDNQFRGTVTASTGSYVGGIIGYINGLDRYNVIENNHYYCDNGVKGIGFIKYIDTNCEPPTAVDGVTYYCTESGNESGEKPSGASKKDHNRTDDPLGADASKLASSPINVRFTLLGDEKHDSDTDGHVHTLAGANLTAWVAEKAYTVEAGASVKEVLELVLEENGMICSNPNGNYVESIIWGDVTLGEFDNGRNSGWMYTLNGVHPELSIQEQRLKEGDVVVFHYTDNYVFESHEHQWSEEWSFDSNYHWHECAWETGGDNSQKDGYGVHTAGEWIVDDALTGKRHKACTVCGYVMESEEGTPHTHTWDAGKVTKQAACTEAGEMQYICTVCGTAKTETIPAAGHQFGEWTTAEKATVFAAEVQSRTCSACGTKETRTAGSKLQPTIELNAKKLPLKVEQSTTALKVSGLANGDSVKSWKSSNKKIVTVNKNGKITAKNKTGKATITVTLASGKTARVKVTVQKNAVRTKKISRLEKKIELRKGDKLSLKPVIKPITSLEKVKFSSSNKKVVKVNSKGRITANKKGKAKITVRSGSKKFVVTVTVK